jgi:dihydroxyacetone synthase
MNGHVDLTELTQTVHRHRDDDKQAIKDVRKLVIDICRQNGGGHGGSAIGMAPMAVALWRHAMRYNPANPDVSYYS